MQLPRHNTSIMSLKYLSPIAISYRIDDGSMLRQNRVNLCHNAAGAGILPRGLHAERSSQEINAIWIRAGKNRNSIDARA